ncbi:MAG: ABC transporter ATP-binding protein [Candidatus Rokubacteria bacterium]|nr:ABC transporter ATP-binding protein [Candidatus Rokubacteria bacterium]
MDDPRRGVRAARARRPGLYPAGRGARPRRWRGDPGPQRPGEPVVSPKLSSEVRLEGVGKRYGEVWAVREVSLTILPGEFFTLLGPSGCGKTTLLRMVAGFARPDAGRILLDGQPIDPVPPWKRDVGLVFQHYALWPHLTVHENVAFGLRERKLPRAEIADRVRAALSQVGLEGFDARRPSQLSGGQQQRVALARTLAVQPRLLLLDEPLSNLDAQLRAQMRLELARLQRDLAITTIYVTHDQAEALSLSNRVAVLQGGSVVQEGTPEDIYLRPHSRFVAEFVGAANLLPVQVVEVRETGVLVEAVAGTRLPVPTDPTRWRPGSRALLCLRPEALRLEEAALGRGTGFLATVAARVFEGDRHIYEVKVGEGTHLRVELPALGEGRIFRLGDRIRVEFSAEGAVLLPEP